VGLRRLRTPDALFLAGALGVFGVCFFLHLNQMLRGGMAWVPMYVTSSEDAHGFPVVRGFWSGPEVDAPGLAAADRLLAVGDASLRGVGPLGFVARVYEKAAGGLVVPIRFERAGMEGAAELHLSPVPYPWRKTLVALSLVAVGTLLFLRMRGAPAGRLFLVASTGYALNWTDFWGGPPLQTYAAVLAFAVGTSLAFPIALRLMLLVPDELARHDRLARFGPWIFAVVGIALTSWAFAVPLAPQIGMPLAHTATVALILTMLVVLAGRWRHASAPGRRQIKWVLLGFYIGLVPALVASVLTLLEPRLWWLYEAALASAIAIPVCLAVALARYNLFDVDRLITAAASYTVLSIVFLGALLVMVPRVASALAGVVDPMLTQAGLSLAVAALVLPTQRRLEGRIGSALFPERRALEQAAQRVREDLARCAKPAELLSLLGERLQALLRVETAVIYSRAERIYVPVFAHGRAIAPALEAGGPMLKTLGETADAADVKRLGPEDASPTERAALQTMGVELVVPLVYAGELDAIVCLGEKGSGDLFTSTDRALLEGIAARAADLLQRFGEAERHRGEREMNERLRRYVPGTVAEEIASGAVLETAEREVTVLFVDIRGYSTYSQTLPAQEIFSTVNRYTEAVSSAVREGGGTVVEFNGDGMMAIFGAPRALAEKERAAVRTARRIVEAVHALEIDNAEGKRLSVGVGIATGLDFVGNIQAVDRFIWSAIGNTTNLAARLQALTRDIRAAIAVDATTFEAAPEECVGFAAHPKTPIRGRDEPIDVHALPLPVAA
jgi:class 3 adenylate cyclase